MEPLERIARLEAELKQLKKEVGQKPERWEPHKEGSFISWDGDVTFIVPNGKNLANCFRTEQLAELRHKQRQAEDELFNIWEHLVGDWRPDFSKRENLFNLVGKYDGRVEDNYVRDYHSCPHYRLFPTQELAKRQYELASDHARAYIRGEF